MELLNPLKPMDGFLERMAERLGCVAALCLSFSEGRVELVGAAGLSAASRALPLPPFEPSELAVPLPYPELQRLSITRTRFELGRLETPAGPTQQSLLLCFDGAPGLQPQYRSMLQRLVEIVRASLSHRRTLEDLRRSYVELEHAQEVALHRERLAALGEMAAVVAHEVRNPLGVVFNCVSALRKSALAGQDELLLSTLSEEAERLNKIVGDLLDFARPDDLSFSSERVEEVILGALQAVQTASPEPSARKVEAELAEDLPPVTMDARLMRQALINLVVNSLQALPAAGSIRVRAHLEPIRGQPWIRIDVIDDGPGIPPELQERIFEPFFTTKSFGTGLGLAIVKRIIQTHRGTLSVSSAAGAGTTVTLRLPAQRR